MMCLLGTFRALSKKRVENDIDRMFNETLQESLNDDPHLAAGHRPTIAGQTGYSHHLMRGNYNTPRRDR